MTSAYIGSDWNPKRYCFVDRCYQGEWRWLTSEALELEIARTPNFEKRLYLHKVLTFAHDRITIDNDVILRTKELLDLGFKSFDALHIASAERGKADLVLTTDDKLLKLAARHETKLQVTLANPLTWLMENV